MATETEDQEIAPVASADEVSDAEYLAWEKGEEAAEGDDEPAEAVEAEEPAEEPAGETEEEAEPVAEEEPAPAAEEEDDSQLSRGLKKRLDKIRERERDAYSCFGDSCSCLEQSSSSSARPDGVASGLLAWPLTAATTSPS